MGRVVTTAWRASQPAQPVGIDWGNPIAAGLTFAAIPVGNVFYDCVTGVFGTNNGTITPGIRSRNGGKSRTEYVRALIAGSANTNYVQFPISLLRGGNMTTTGTMLALASTETQVDGNFYGICGNTDSVGTGEGFGLEIDSYAQIDRGDILKTNYSAGGVLGNSAAAALGNPFNNQLHFFGYAFSGNGASGNYLYGGSGEAFSGASTHGTTTTNRRASIFSVSTTQGRHDVAVGLVLFWNRQLSVAEYKSLYDNPWQLFTRTGVKKMRAAASGAASHAASGALAAQAATLAGTAAHLTLHATTGALAAAAATAAGSAAHLTLHATTGALVAQAATIAGSAQHLTLHASSGVLSAQAATLAGTAAHEHAATGALAAGAVTIAGAAAHLTLHATSGALATGSATMAGTAAHEHAASGSLVVSAATIVGAAAHTAPNGHAATGALAADAATVAGSALHLTLHAATGALAAQVASITGASAHQHAAAGALASDAASVAGAAAHNVLHSASGALAAGSATVAGAATRTAPGVHATTGALAADAAAIAGTAVHVSVAPPIGGGGLAAYEIAQREARERRRRATDAAIAAAREAVEVPRVVKVSVRDTAAVRAALAAALPRPGLPPRSDASTTPGAAEHTMARDAADLAAAEVAIHEALRAAEAQGLEVERQALHDAIAIELLTAAVQ